MRHSQMTEQERLATVRKWAAWILEERRRAESARVQPNPRVMGAPARPLGKASFAYPSEDVA